MVDVKSIYIFFKHLASWLWSFKKLEIICNISQLDINYFLFLKRFYLFREGGKERKRGGEKHQCVVASHVAPTGDLASGHVP